MELVEPRKRQVIDEERRKLVSQAAVERFEKWQAEGYLAGVWRDGEYYLLGKSHHDMIPEEISQVMTAQEYEAYKEGRLNDNERAVAITMRRAKNLYPSLFHSDTLLEMFEEWSREK